MNPNTTKRILLMHLIKHIHDTNSQFNQPNEILVGGGWDGGGSYSSNSVGKNMIIRIAMIS